MERGSRKEILCGLGHVSAPAKAGQVWGCCSLVGWTIACPFHSLGSAQYVYRPSTGGYISIWGHLYLRSVSQARGIFSRCGFIRHISWVLIEIQKSKQFASNMSPHMSSPMKAGIVLGANGRRFPSFYCVWKLDSSTVPDVFGLRWWAAAPYPGC